MHENEKNDIVVESHGADESTQQFFESSINESSTVVTEVPATNQNKKNKITTMPKPVFIRMLMLFCGGVGCLFVGIIVSFATGDSILMAMSAIIFATFITKGLCLEIKSDAGSYILFPGSAQVLHPKCSEGIGALSL